MLARGFSPAVSGLRKAEKGRGGGRLGADKATFALSVAVSGRSKNFSKSCHHRDMRSRFLRIKTTMIANRIAAKIHLNRLVPQLANLGNQFDEPDSLLAADSLPESLASAPPLASLRGSFCDSP